MGLKIAVKAHFRAWFAGEEKGRGCFVILLTGIFFGYIRRHNLETSCGFVVQGEWNV